MANAGSALSDVTILATMAAAAFLAATLLPGGSEVVFLGFLASGFERPFALFLVAVVANTAGGMTNWWIGRLIADGLETERGRRFVERARLDPQSVARVQRLFARYGWWTLLLAWAPIVGDPILVVAGMSRLKPLPTLLVSGLGRALRYGLLWAGAAGVLAFVA